MSTLIRQLGFNTDTPNIGRADAVFTLSNGNAVAVVYDANVSGAGSGYGDLTNVPKLYVYESVDRITWTLRSTLSLPTGTHAGGWSAGIYPNNDLGIAVITGTVSSGTIYSPVLLFYKWTYTTYVIAASETVHTAGVSTESDAYPVVSVTDGSIPVVGVYRQNTSGSTRTRMLVFVRRTSDSTWQQAISYNLTTTLSSRAASDAFHLSVIQGGSGTATDRRIVAAVGSGLSNTPDQGVKFYGTTINETTGAGGTVNFLGTTAIGDAVTVGARHVVVFPSAANEVTIGIGHTDGTAKIYVARYTYTGGTAWESTLITPTSRSMGVAASGKSSGGSLTGQQAFTYSNDVLAWAGFYVVSTKSEIRVAHFNINRGTNVVTAGDDLFDNGLPAAGQLQRAVQGGVNRSTVIGKFDFIWQHRQLTNSQYQLRHGYVIPTRAPAAITPVTGASVATGRPPITADADLDRQYPQSRIKMYWEFASDAGFTSNLVSYTQDDSKYAAVTGTHVAGVTVKFTDQVPSSVQLATGTWHHRAAHVDEYRVRGAFSTSQSFTVAHPPAANNLAPRDNQLLNYGTSGAVQFSWGFTDPDSTDYQTAFEVEVSRNDTGAVILTSGKVSSTTNSWISNIPAPNADMILQWRVRLYDRDDAVGVYSDFALFQVGTPPTATISFPVSTVDSSAPKVDFTPTASGGRAISAYRVVVTTGGQTIYNSGTISIPATSPSGVLISHVDNDADAFENGLSYTVTVTITDSVGLTGTSPPVVFTAAWVTPATATRVRANTTQYNVETGGFVTITWNDDNRDPDFSAWVIQRRDDLLDGSGTTVITTGTWKTIGYVYDPVPSGTYLYQDYYAPSSYKVTYRVEQAVNRFGDTLTSVFGEEVVVYPRSEGYWIITGDNTAFLLTSVTSDDYTEEYEEETFNVAGRGRHVDRGDRLGVMGTLNVQIRGRFGQTARQRKQRLEAMKALNAALYLRTPFGDVFRIHAGNLQITRVAGVGTQEFVDVSIPYTEVGL